MQFASQVGENDDWQPDMTKNPTLCHIGWQYNVTMNDAREKRLAIVGGGAAGLAAAIAAGEAARDAGALLQIVVYERDDRVGRSILATGNGRCNFSNARLQLGEYHNSDFVAQAFTALERLRPVRGCGEPVTSEVSGLPRHVGVRDEAGRSVLEFLESCGLEWREEADGRRYPLANKASVVVDVLRAAARTLGVCEQCGVGVKAVEAPRKPGGCFTLRMADGVFERADAVIVACGGRALSALDVAGLRKKDLKPILGPLRVAADDIPFVRELDNIRVRCSVRLFRERGDDLVLLGSEKGELMFRKYGVSGICVFNLSRMARPGDQLSLNFLDIGDLQHARDYLRFRRDKLVARFGVSLTCADLLRGLVLPRVSEALLKSVGIDEGRTCDADTCDELADLLWSYPLEVAGIGDEDVCQVRRGGFSVDGFDSATMQSKEISGLYVVGEALDVDGPCGGYNLHWAWTSGLLAGASACRE